MIIIYNLSGLILGVAGIGAGLLVAMATGSIGGALLVLSIVWIAGGFWWHSRERPFPAIFFIPLPFIAMPLAMLAVPLLLVQPRAHAEAADQRSIEFRADEKMLDAAAATGDIELSQSILAALRAVPTEEGASEPYSVCTHTAGDSALVLVKAVNLKKYKDPTRHLLLQEIRKVVRDRTASQETRLFIGIKGRLTYGAVETPPGDVRVASSISESKLFDFYGPKSTAAAAPMRRFER